MFLQLLMMFAFVGFFEASLGTVLWIYSGETTTDKGVGIVLGINWIMSVIVGLVFPLVSSEAMLGIPGTFFICSFFCLMAVIVVLLWVVETQGMTSDEVRKKFYRSNSLTNDYSR